MKRDFGKKLIEEFLPTVETSHVIDASGAYIPDHGIHPSILFGRRSLADRTRRTVLVYWRNQEPGQP